MEGSTIESVEAWVTPVGIFFRGDYYSCRKALKEQWFQRAREAGAWTIDLLLDPSKGSSSPIYIAGSEVTMDDLCFPLGESASSPQAARDQYQAKIRELRERLHDLTGFMVKK